MEVNYTYDELQRAKIEVLISSLVKELAWQNKIEFYDMSGKRVSDSETILTLEDRMGGMDQEQYIEFREKICRLLCNM